MMYVNGHLRHFGDDDPVFQAAYKAWNDMIYFGAKQYNVEKKRNRSASKIYV